ncbi:MAG: cytosine permease [Thermaerobacter sp.]|nr:cytosine permease [Thermaerobacter sp.]
MVNHNAVATGDAVFHVETHGIDVIDAKARHGKPKELFWVWLAGQLTFSGFIIGQLFTQMGLSLWESLAVSALCALSFVILGWASLPGSKAGTATLTITRAIFGVKGNVVPSLFSWLNMVGWEAVTTVLTVYAFLSVFGVVGLPANGTGPLVAAIILSIVLTFSIPILGHATVVVMQRILAYGVGVLSVVLFFVIAPHVHWNYAPAASAMWTSGLTTTMIFALSIGLMSTVLSWTNYASDYTRYLPKDSNGKQIVMYTWLGSGLAAFVVLALGVMLGTITNPKMYASNPVGAIMAVLPHWYVLPFLAVTILGQVTANYLNAYSSAMSFLAMGFRIKRYQSAILDATVAILVALYALFFAPQFLSFFINFLSLSVLVIGPWTAMFIVHYWLSRGRYDSHSLVLMSPKSAYWYQNGWNWSALGIFLASAFLALWTVNSTLWVSPLSKTLFGGMDLSSFSGPIIAGLLYALYYKKVLVPSARPLGLELDPTSN